MTEARLSSNVVGTKKLAALLVFGGALFCMGAPISLAQASDPMAIRVESREVVVPLWVEDRSYLKFAKCENHGHLILDGKEITGLSASEIHIFEDGIEQRVQSVSLEPLRSWLVHDNYSEHAESSATPRGIWAGPDAWWHSDCVYHAAPAHVYLVSYVPSQSVEGSCHQIKVRVDRRHASISAREEYCNIRYSPSDPLNGTRLGRQMDGYANSTQDGQFPLSVQVGTFFGNSGTSSVDIAVEFPWDALNREWHGVNMGENLEAMVAVSGTIYDKDKVLVARFSESAPNISEGRVYYSIGVFSFINVSEARKETECNYIPSRYETQLDLPPGDYDLKLVVTDGKNFGRAEVPLSVDRPPGESPALSGILFCKRYHKLADGPSEGVRAPAYVPMVSNGVEFTPAGDTHFKKNQQLVSYFEIYEPLFGKTEVEKVQFRMRVTDAETGELKTDTGLRPVESWARPGMSVIAIAREIAISGLSPGTYRLEVQASDSAGRSTPWRAASFTVEQP